MDRKSLVSSAVSISTHRSPGLSPECLCKNTFSCQMERSSDLLSVSLSPSGLVYTMFCLLFWPLAFLVSLFWSFLLLIRLVSVFVSTPFAVLCLICHSILSLCMSLWVLFCLMFCFISFFCLLSPVLIVSVLSLSMFYSICAFCSVVSSFSVFTVLSVCLFFSPIICTLSYFSFCPFISWKTFLHFWCFASLFHVSSMSFSLTLPL